MSFFSRPVCFSVSAIFQALKRKKGNNLATVELSEVLSQEQLRGVMMVDTENLLTLAVAMSKAQEKDWLQEYESIGSVSMFFFSSRNEGIESNNQAHNISHAACWLQPQLPHNKQKNATPTHSQSHQLMKNPSFWAHSSRDTAKRRKQQW